MTPEPLSFDLLVALARTLLGRLTCRDGLDRRPWAVRPGVRDRLASGLRLLSGFVRRLLLLMALHLEHGLVDATGPMRRPHKCKGKPALRFAVLESRVATDWEALADRLAPAAPKPPRWTLAGQTLVPLDRLYRQLDLLTAILANPEPRARRLAFHLARNRPGVILPPQHPLRLPGSWGTEAHASHSAMAAAIIDAGRIRPPPLPPRRSAWPTACRV